MKPRTNNSYNSLLHPSLYNLRLNQPAIVVTVAKDWEIVNRTFTDCDLFFCRKGSARFIANEKTYILKEGCALLVNPGMKISATHTQENRFSVVAQHFSFLNPYKKDLFSSYTGSPFFDLSANKKLLSLFSDYLKIGCDRFESFAAHSQFYRILSEIIETIPQCFFEKQRSSEQENLQLVEKIISEIKKNLHEKNLLSLIYEKSPLSKRQTERIFLSIMGVPPKEYILSLKLNRASEALLQGVKCKEAAYIAGFDDELYFSRIFKKKKGVAPSYFLSGGGKF